MSTSSLLIQPKPNIIIPASRWIQDPGIADLVDYFNEPGRYGKWESLTTYELEEIAKQIQLCRENFTYAAKNYFRIKTKSGQEKLFSLWESQELLLELITRLREQGVPVKLLIIKARQLGCSTLIEALIAHGTIFFPGVDAMVTSYDPDHAAYLFWMMQFIYDRLPWWMQPMCSSREYKEGLKFENPDTSQRNTNPGLNSSVIVQAANKMTGVGTGRTLAMFHGSEFAKWHPVNAQRILEVDVPHALALQNPRMMAVLESTAQRAGNYAHDLWLRQIELGDRAIWNPIFLPSFFDRTHFVAPPSGWEPKKEEINMDERVQRDWVRCDARDCQQYQERYYRLADRTDTLCPTCRTGMLRSYNLSDGFKYWMEIQRVNANNEESLANLRQEAAVTAEEAFQIAGDRVFNERAQEFANLCVKTPIIRGVFDAKGVLHGVTQGRNGDTKCPVDGCQMLHYLEDMPLRIYRLPEREVEYTMGGDPAGGEGGRTDNSVASINRVGRFGGMDEQVAVFSSNNTNPIEFAKIMNFLGRMYNDALAAVETNRFDTACSYLGVQLQYPNMYRMVNLAAATPTAASRRSGRMGWNTSVASKPRLYVTMSTWLKERLMVLRDRATVEEMKTFVKEDDSVSTGAAKNFKDDHLMAQMIALHVAHELDWDDMLGTMNPKKALTLEEAPWIMSCMACTNLWPANSPADFRRCPACANMQISGTQNVSATAYLTQSADKELDGTDMVRSEELEYDEL